MDLFIPLLSSVFLFIIVAGANQANLEPQIYWRTILPHTPMPSAIEQFLQPDVYHNKPETSVNVGKDGVNINDGKGTSVNFGHGGVGVQTGPNHKPGGTTVNVGKVGVGVVVKPNGKPFVDHVSFSVKDAATDAQLHDDPAVPFLFLRQDLRRGKKFTLQLAYSGRGATTFVPRSLAESIPFSTAELPAILAQFSIPVGSAEAAATAKTLSECEEAPLAGEKKLCATSLESMVDFARTSLGTSELVAVETEGGGSAGKRQVYKIGSVRMVAAAGGKGVVACHPEAYAYAVFICHATASSEVYEVEMAAEGGGTGVKAVAVCHTDTAGWNPKNLAFRVLKVKPGAAVPVCHFLPQDHLVWVKKV